MICSVDGCGKPLFVVQRKLCKTHYHRMMRTGGLKISRNAPDLEKVCSVSGCGRAAKSKGYCESHYSNFRRIGVPVPPERPNVVRAKVSTDGYVYTWESKIGKVLLQHRVVMAEILGRPLLPSESVNHKNGQRSDNRPENLELWSRWQPAGQRVEDKLKWAREFIALYG